MQPNCLPFLPSSLDICWSWSKHDELSTGTAVHYVLLEGKLTTDSVKATTIPMHINIRFDQWSWAFMFKLWHHIAVDLKDEKEHSFAKNPVCIG